MISLGSIRGTTLEIDISFFFLVAFFVILNYDPALGVHYALLWILIIFISVLVHELAHAATIGMFGYGPSRVILGGMGGVTINARVAKPWHDMLISVAGPLSSFGLMFAMIAFYGTGIPERDAMLRPLVAYLALMNKWWGWFNLLPVPPLDGGHFVRHLLRTFLPERTAFTIAIWIAMIGGGAAALWFALQREVFIAVLIGWFTFMAFQQWNSER
jgi:Zn-dependent protease